MIWILIFIGIYFGVCWIDKQGRCKRCGSRLIHWDTRKAYCGNCDHR